MEGFKKIMEQCSLLLRKMKKSLLIFHKILQLLFDMYKKRKLKRLKIYQMTLIMNLQNMQSLYQFKRDESPMNNV